MLISLPAFAAEYASALDEASALSAAVHENADFKKLTGKAITLILENDILGALAENGESGRARSLKEKADIALAVVSAEETEAAVDAVKALCRETEEALQLLSGGQIAVSFYDVSMDAWYYPAVQYTVQEGIFKGIDENHFAPDMPITRGMFLALMGRKYMETGAKYPKGFSDVENDAYYADAVNWAKTYGILSFVAGDIFEPDKPITREELVTVLRGSMEYAGYSTGVTETARFTDSKSISPFAFDSVNWAAEKKIVSGFEDGAFRPFGSATRAQVAQIFLNLR